MLLAARDRRFEGSSCSSARGREGCFEFEAQRRRRLRVRVRVRVRVPASSRLHIFARAFSHSFIACRTPRSIMISSDPPGDGVRAHVAVEPLHLLPLPAPNVRRAAENLRRFPRAVLEHFGALDFGQRGDTGERLGALLLCHGAHLVGDVLHHAVGGVDLPDHVRELGTNHGVLDESLTEGPPAVGVLERLLVAHPARIGSPAPRNPIARG